MQADVIGAETRCLKVAAFLGIGTEFVQLDTGLPQFPATVPVGSVSRYMVIGGQ